MSDDADEEIHTVQWNKVASQLSSGLTTEQTCDGGDSGRPGSSDTDSATVRLSSTDQLS